MSLLQQFPFSCYLSLSPFLQTWLVVLLPAFLPSPPLVSLFSFTPFLPLSCVFIAFAFGLSNLYFSVSFSTLYFLDTSFSFLGERSDFSLIYPLLIPLKVWAAHTPGSSAAHHAMTREEAASQTVMKCYFKFLSFVFKVIFM